MVAALLGGTSCIKAAKVGPCRVRVPDALEILTQDSGFVPVVIKIKYAVFEIVSETVCLTPARTHELMSKFAQI